MSTSKGFVTGQRGKAPAGSSSDGLHCQLMLCGATDGNETSSKCALECRLSEFRSLLWLATDDVLRLWL